MKKPLYQIIWILIPLTVLASIACQKDEWQDEQGIYLCPDCRDKAYVYMVGSCERCGEMTASISFMYCYDCVKETNACQRCGVER